MSGLWALLVLLAVAWLGGLVGPRNTSRGQGLASGAEWVALGFVVGPAVLGLVSREITGALAPLAGAGVAWLAAIVGLEHGAAGRKLAPARQLAAVLLVLPPFLLVAAAVAATLAWREGTAFLGGRDHLLLSLWVAAALAATSRSAMRWAVERQGARGPVAQLLGDLTFADDLAPVIVLSALSAHSAVGLVREPAGLVGAGVASLALGAVVGLGAALLVRLDARDDAIAATLLGTTLVVAGLATWLGLSLIASAYALGRTTAMASGSRERLASLADRLERPVLLPTLVVAGSLVDPLARPGLLPIAAAAIAALLAGKVVSSLALAAASPPLRRSALALGPALASPGPFAMCVGLVASLRSPGGTGGAVLACAAAAVVAGELLSPTALRRALGRAGALEARPPAGGAPAALPEAGP